MNIRHAHTGRRPGKNTVPGLFPAFRIQRLLAAGILAFGMLLFLPAADTATVRQLDISWKKATGGDAVCPVRVFRNRIFILGSDRALTCMREDGAFLWRKPLAERPAPMLYVSRSGLVCTFSRSGVLTAFNPDGILLWEFRGKKGELPLCLPYEGRDGRLFLLYGKEILCLAANGLQKWRRTVPPAERILPFLTEDGHGNPVILDAEGGIFPFSPWGDIFPAASAGVSIAAAVPVPGTGCALFVPASAGTWEIRTVSLRPAAGSRSAENGGPEILPEVLWKKAGLPPCAAVFYRNGTLYYAGEDGKIFLLNATDGNLLRGTGLAGTGGKLSGASFFFIPGHGGGRLILVAEQMCAALSPSGEIVWQKTFPQSLSGPVWTENGFAVSAPQNTIVTGFRAEFSLKGAANPEPETPPAYGIFAGKSRDYGMPEPPAFSYFSETEKHIGSGQLGNAEPEISRKLAEILNNDTGNPFSAPYSGVYRSRAAMLLGRMGSEEARTVLLRAAQKETAPAVTAGILYGLAALGPEAGRKTFDTVVRLSRSRNQTPETQRALCTALCAAARNSGAGVLAEAAEILLSYTEEPNGAATRKYANQMLEKLLE